MSVIDGRARVSITVETCHKKHSSAVGKYRKSRVETVEMTFEQQALESHPNGKAFVLIGSTRFGRAALSMAFRSRKLTPIGFQRAPDGYAFEVTLEAQPHPDDVPTLEAMAQSAVSPNRFVIRMMSCTATFVSVALINSVDQIALKLASPY